MKQIINKKETEFITPNEADESFIYIAFNKKYKSYWKLQKNQSTRDYSFVSLEDSYNSYFAHDGIKSISEALKRRLDENFVIYQFDNLKEALQWMLDNE